jgi:hypothetical protein
MEPTTSRKNQMKPLTPLSGADFCSPFGDLRKENARLKDALAVAPNGTRVLEETMFNFAARKFIKSEGLWEEFKRLNPGL